MKAIVIAIAATLPLAALAQQAAPARAEAGFQQRVHQRYCAKLRESPEAYVQFVRRLQTVHGYTYSDFAPEYRGARVVADCGVSQERVAAVYRELSKPAS
jgi:hypothetical protein